jgi:hypothetical protein
VLHTPWGAGTWEVETRREHEPSDLIRSHLIPSHPISSHPILQVDTTHESTVRATFVGKTHRVTFDEVRATHHRHSPPPPTTATHHRHLYRHRYPPLPPTTATHRRWQSVGLAVGAHCPRSPPHCALRTLCSWAASDWVGGAPCTQCWAFKSTREDDGDQASGTAKIDTPVDAPGRQCPKL